MTTAPSSTNAPPEKERVGYAELVGDEAGKDRGHRPKEGGPVYQRHHRRLDLSASDVHRRRYQDGMQRVLERPGRKYDQNQLRPRVGAAQGQVQQPHR